MKAVPNISEAEWEIMKVLWAKSPLRSQEIVAALPEDITWKPKTTQTLINRLTDKGAIGYERHGKNHYYYPKVRQRDCIAAESLEFLDRICDGSLTPMVASLIKKKKVSEKEIEELRKLLEKKE